MKNFFEEYHELLYNCNKPYRYVGGEFLSRNKDFDSAKVTLVFAFPDKYEIGISNLGQRVLYGIVNDNPDFMADRVYAPDIDFRENLIKEEKEFYSLEAKKPLKDFDLIGFSLQYELAYPTVLAMMKMANIPVRNDERDENCPIVTAGGPCTFNPLPMTDFIDVFFIGDGENSVRETCEIIKEAKEKGLSRREKLEKIASVEGAFVPSVHKSADGTYKRIKKSIVQINYDNAQKSYPIPFSTSVQDRATVEIRRGCGRMCRFCQPGHVTLPVRERSAEDIIKIAKELVKNTGYNEYSLLSLSSNDYANIKEVIKELSVDFDKNRISVSLPSQRIDGFNLELANLVQKVRKSTMTLAPEAGSQRLRDTIRKNISEEQILNAITTLYENGWDKIKLYFIIGLPTETYEDIDETVALFEKIKHITRALKREKGIKHGLNITCTLSIFVPKPFTPFQWFGQVDLQEVSERIRYLKEKTKYIKGLKINYHERYVSQIEAVLTRGDESLNKYIEALFKKGCYLDTWDENFDEDIWHDTACELGINLEELAEKHYSLDEKLPWNFIDIGVDEEWFKNEYRASLKSETHPSCQTGCVNCGVCKSFKTHKVMAEPYISEKAKEFEKEKAQEPENQQIQEENKTTYRIKLTKKGILRYFSHLDWQNTFLKAVARTGLPVAFSHGFNPSMKVSLGVALPLFMESECELADIELLENESIKLEGTEFGLVLDEKELRNTAIKYYKKYIQGTFENHPILGKIQFTRKGITKTRDSSADLRKIKSIYLLKEIIKTSLYEGSAPIYKQRKDGFKKFHYLINKIQINNQLYEHRIIIGEDSSGLKYYDINDIKIGSSAVPKLQNLDANEPNHIITNSNKKINIYNEAKISNLKLKLEKVLPKDAKIISIVKLDKSAKPIDHTAQWAEYEIRNFDNTIQNFDSLKYNASRVLSLDEILMPKKNKKGLITDINIKSSVKSFRFEENSLFVVLKTGQGSDIPAVRADNLMKLISPDEIFDIKRIKFFDENLKEI